MAGGVTAEVQTVKLISKLLVINFVLKLYALKNVFECGMYEQRTKIGGIGMRVLKRAEWRYQIAKWSEMAEWTPLGNPPFKV